MAKTSRHALCKIEFASLFDREHSEWYYGIKLAPDSHTKSSSSSSLHNRRNYPLRAAYYWPFIGWGYTGNGIIWAWTSCAVCAHRFRTRNTILYVSYVCICISRMPHRKRYRAHMLNSECALMSTRRARSLSFVRALKNRRARLNVCVFIINNFGNSIQHNTQHYELPIPMSSLNRLIKSQIVVIRYLSCSNSPLFCWYVKIVDTTQLCHNYVLPVRRVLEQYRAVAGVLKEVACWWY